VKNSGRQFVFAVVLCVSSCVALSQSTANAPCTVELPSFATSAPNIFNDRQEQDLGDALAEYFESELRLAPQTPDDRLTRIGERLLATLPPTGLHYKFRVYDSGEINGFSSAGGRVYISRKLIAAVTSEDELAGVLAHEIGHISTHQIAIVFTRAFRVRLGVTQVTDRADIFARVHQLFTTRPKMDEVDDTEDKREIVADRVALYAMVRAGYAPKTYASFFDQASMNKGKTGSWLSDMFGKTHENAQRYRSALKLIDELPEGCRQRQPAVNDSFTAWQHGVVQEQVKAAAEDIDGDSSMALDPPLRPSLSHIRFSPDGHFLLAQDEVSISVVDKDAGKALFRIDAPEAENAQFTPDSKSVVFHDSKLRVEKWAVASGTRTSVKELVVFGGCNQTLLAPDAKTFACAFVNIHGDYLRLGVRLIDVESGKPFFENEGFFEPGIYTPYAYKLWLAAKYQSEQDDLMNMLTSPDGKYLLLVAGNRVLAYDLATRQPVTLGEGLKKLSQARMSFLGDDQLFAVFEGKGKGMYAARILTFPGGLPVKETEIGDQQIAPVTKGEAVMIHPLKDYAVAIFDPIQGKILTAAKLPAVDAWNNTIALEDALGGVAVAQAGIPGSKHISLTPGPMPVAQGSAFSPDGKYLAVSLKNRATIWNLESGKQLKTVRPFRSAWIDDKNQLFGFFPKYLTRDPAVLQLALDPFASTELAKQDDNAPEYSQYRDLQYTFKPMDKKEASQHHIALQDKAAFGARLLTGKVLPPDYHATLEVKKMSTQAVLWSRDYPDQTPACWPAEDNRLVLAWDVGNASAHAEIKNNPALQKQLEALKDKKKGLLIETVLPETGAPLEQVIVPEVDLSRGWFDSRRAMVSGKYVLARGEDRVTTIYRLNDGSKVGEFFGAPMATDSAIGMVAAVNRENEILLVDEENGRELKRYTFASPVRLARFASGKDSKLMVLTADQVLHRLPLPERSESARALATPRSALSPITPQ
jgi:WD40 repeat protein